MEQHEREIFDLVDLIIINSPKFRGFTFDNILLKIKETHPINPSVGIVRDVMRVMRKHGYSETSPNGFEMLTELGLMINEAGGYYEYLKIKQLDEIEKQTKNKIELENLIYSTKVNKYLYKTRWLPHILALVALLISLYTLLRDNDKEKQNVQVENSSK